MTGAEVALDGDGRIAAEVPCRRCGYVLRGLAPTGRCPECRSSVERSLRGDLLAFCEPTWVERVALGAWWIVVALLWLIVGFTIFMILGVALDATAAYWRFGLLGVLGLHGAAFAGGAWLLTTPDPGAPAHDPDRGTRLRARAGMVAYGATPLIVTLLPAAPGVATAFALIGGAAAVRVGGVIAGHAWIRRLGQRLPDPELVTACRRCLYGLLLALVLVAAERILRAAGLTPGAPAAAGPPGARTAATVVSCVGRLLILYYGVWAIRLLAELRRALARAAREARATWAAPDPPEVR